MKRYTIEGIANGKWILATSGSWATRTEAEAALRRLKKSNARNFGINTDYRVTEAKEPA